MTIRNNVTRMLAAKGVDFTPHSLPVEKVSAEEAAELLGLPPDRVYKTIVVTRRGRGKPILAMVPAKTQVDLKALARAIGEKKVTLPSQREAEELTGLESGGISPLALLHRSFDIVLDERALEHERITISGGERGLNISLPVEDLLALTVAGLGAICTSPEDQESHPGAPC